MKTYNFFVFIGSNEQIVEINAQSEEEALDIMSEQFPHSEGWRYVLM